MRVSHHGRALLARPLTPIAAAAGLLLASGVARAQGHDVLAETGPAENRIDLVVTGDGYTAAERETLRADAQAAVDRLFDVSPYDHHRGIFNTYVVYATSLESGADHPSRGEYRETAFDATFDYLGVERLIGIDVLAVVRAVNAEVPQYDYIICVVNDPEYGGSGGDVTVFSTHPSAAELVRHEFSHTYADLADEYEAAYVPATDDSEPNVSFAFERAALKWSDWVEASTPLPTPVEAAIDFVHPTGAYEGAKYTPTGIYRPAPDCRMRSLSRPFCDVCGEALVLTGWFLVDPIDAVAPVEGTVPLAPAVTFAVTPAIGSGALSVAWTLDGTPLAAGSETLALDPESVPPGDHELVVTVHDSTALVRTDRDDLRSSDRRWTVTGGTATGADADADADDAIGDAEDDDAGDADGGSSGDEGGCGCRAAGSAGRVGPVAAVVVLLSVPVVRRGRRRPRG